MPGHTLAQSLWDKWCFSCKVDAEKSSRIQVWGWIGQSHPLSCPQPSSSTRSRASHEDRCTRKEEYFRSCSKRICPNPNAAPSSPHQCGRAQTELPRAFSQNLPQKSCLTALYRKSELCRGFFKISAIYTNQVLLLNQCIIIFTRTCNLKTDIKDFQRNATHLFWTNVISGIYDNSFSERKTKLIETNFVLSINAIGIQYVLPVTK